MLKHRKWLVVLLLLFVVGSTNATDKDGLFPIGEEGVPTFGIEITDTFFES